MANHPPVGAVGDPCTECGRSIADYGNGPEHRRGRVQHGSPDWYAVHRARGRAYAHRLANPRPGYCDCGKSLKNHPPLPKPGPLTAPGWPSRDVGILERSAL